MNPTNQPKRVVFPTTRFFPDKNDDGTFVIDEQSKEFKSGRFELKLYEGYGQNVREVASVVEPMSFIKYKAVREDVDTMSVEALKEKYPELKEGLSVAEKRADEDALKAENKNAVANDQRDAKIAQLESQLRDVLTLAARALDARENPNRNMNVVPATEEKEDLPHAPEISPTNTVERNVEPEGQKSSEKESTTNEVQRNVVPEGTSATESRVEPVVPDEAPEQVTREDIQKDNDEKTSVSDSEKSAGQTDGEAEASSEEVKKSTKAGVKEGDKK